jgi:phosphorylated CTD-interacting factor 1
MSEGGGPGLDPLLPSKAPVDEHQLPKELVEAGLSQSAAMHVSSTLSQLSQRAARRVGKIALSPQTGRNVRKINSNEEQVQLVYQTTSLFLSEDHYRKLSNLWELNVCDKNMNKDDNIFCMLNRYEILNGASPGFQMALPEDVFDVLSKFWGVNHECFASPLNCYFPSFCSLFKDTDKCFGSKGSFFDFHPTEGSFEANPPFVEDSMTANVKHIEKILAASDSALSFVIIVPGWDDESCESFQLTKKSKFLREHLTFHKRDHYYKNGMQHRAQASDVYQPSSCSTFVFFMQNDKGAARWPISAQGLHALRKAFTTQSQARTHQCHKSILNKASEKWYEL